MQNEMTMPNTRIQGILMNHIKSLYKKDTREIIMKALGVSRSNAYNRINGTKAMSLDETYKLCYYLNIKLEDVLPKSDGQVVINMASIDEPFEKMEDYPNYLLRLIKYVYQLPQGQVIYLTNEIPVCYFFSSPYLAAFKMYMWSRNTFHQKNLLMRHFQPKLILEDEKFKNTCNSIISLYEKIPRIEIWTGGILRRSLSQISYCHRVGLFRDDRIIYNLVSELKSILKKNLSNNPYYGQDVQKRTLYNQSYFSAEDIILIKSQVTKRVIATFFNPDYFISSDHRLIEKSEKRLEHFIDKSTLIEGEEQRGAYYSDLEKQLKLFLVEL